MIGTYDPYYSSVEVSNSDLTALKMYFSPVEYVNDLTIAYREGNLIDAIITEQHRCNHYNLTVDDEQFTKEEWEKATAMFNAFRKDEFCKTWMRIGQGQSVFKRQLEIDVDGFTISLPARCKYDLFSEGLGYGGDIKSTACTSQKQFEEAVRHFDYDRSRAWYMDISGAPKDFIVGISKVNFKIFKVFIKRGDELYLQGLEKYKEWAFKWWLLIDGLEVENAN